MVPGALNAHIDLTGTLRGITITQRGLKWKENSENMLKTGKIDLFTLNQNFLLLLIVDCYF